MQLKRRGDDEKYTARVLAIGTECDIALLTVEEPAFWEVPIMPPSPDSSTLEPVQPAARRPP